MMSSFTLHLSVVVLLTLFACPTAGSLISTGQTLFLNEIPYYVPATPISTVSSLTSLQSANAAGGLVPITVVEISATNSSSRALASIIDGFVTDDVWNEGFLEGMIPPKWSNPCFIQQNTAPRTHLRESKTDSIHKPFSFSTRKA